MNLYNLTTNYIQNIEILNENVDPTTGEIIEDKEQLKAIEDSISLELKNKADNILKMILVQNNIIDEIKKEEERLKNIRKSKENALSRFKEYVINSMEMLNKTQIDTEVFGKLSIRKSKAVEIEDTTQIPAEYIKTKIEQVPNKVEIKKALQNGANIKGASLKENLSLVIK